MYEINQKPNRPRRCSYTEDTINADINIKDENLKWRCAQNRNHNKMERHEQISTQKGNPRGNTPETWEPSFTNHINRNTCSLYERARDDEVSRLQSASKILVGERRRYSVNCCNVMQTTFPTSLCSRKPRKKTGSRIEKKN